MANTARLVIDPIARKISTKYEKIRLVQKDNNSTRVTFEMPRYVRGHDMSKCSTAEVHYDNISIDRKQKHSDVYVVKDIVVDPEDDKTINFSWLVSRAATKFVGNVDFSLHFGCTEDPSLEYAWHTTTYSGIVVLECKHNTQSVEEKHPDLVASILDYVDKKLSEFDTVDIAQSTGESTEAVMSQKAVTEGLESKVDAVNTTGAHRVYGIDGSTGAQKTYDVTHNNKKGAIPIYASPTQAVGETDNGSTFAVTRAQKDYQPVPLVQLNEGLDGKLDTPSFSGEQIVRYNTMTGKVAGLPFNNATQAYAVPVRDANGNIKSNEPLEALDCANKEYVDEGLGGKVDKPNISLAAIQWVFGQDAKGNPSAIAAEAGNGQWHLARYLKTDDTKADSDRKGTLAVTMPQKPLHAANKQYVDDKVAPIKEDVELLKDLSAGVSYDIVTVKSTVNPVIVPRNALPAATIDKIGTGIKTEVINEALTNTNPSEVTSVLSATCITEGVYRLNGTVADEVPRATFTLITPIDTSEGETIYVSAELLSGSIVDRNGNHSSVYIGICSFNQSWLVGEQGAIVGRGSPISEFTINFNYEPVSFIDAIVAIHIGKQKQTYGVPVASVKKGNETVYTVPEQIRTLKAHAIEGHTPVDVYGLALSDTVYNYLDLVNKQYVIKCAMGIDEHNGLAVVPYEKIIDVSAYLTDEDGEITVSAGDSIMLCDNDGILMPYGVPNAITYCIKKGV